jgi:Ser-tRNA(Ala) deacylase AlaX
MAVPSGTESSTRPERWAVSCITLWRSLWLDYHDVMPITYGFETDPYRRELATEVVRVGEHEGRPCAVPADTVLYPEGGGQPADRGWIGDVAVVDVQRVEDEILHLLDAPVAPGAVTVRLDWPRRFDHMQQHTAQHLLTALAAERFGWRTTAFHLGAALSDIELDVPSLAPDRLDALEEAVAAEIRAARPVTARRVSHGEYKALAVRSRGLPEGLAGDIRLVEIAGIDVNTCGGTHVRSTAEIEGLKLLGTEPMRGGTRLHWVAGGRMRRRLAAHEARSAALRGLLDAGEDDFVPLVERRQGELRELERRLRATVGELASAAAAALAAQPAGPLDAHFEGRDAAFLQQVAREFGRLAPARTALLTAGGEGACFFVVVLGEGAVADVQALGRDVAAALGGRGGGSGRTFQGKATSLAGRDAALATLRRSLGG